MNGILTIYLLLTIIYLMLGIIIYLKDARGVNKSFAFLSFNLSVLSFLNSWCLLYEGVPIDTIILRIIILLDAMIYFEFLVFIIFLTEHDHWLDKIWKKLLVSLPTVIAIFLYAILDFDPMDFAKVARGQLLFQDIHQGYFHNSYFYIYLISYILFALILLVKWYRNSVLKRKKTQAIIVFIATFMAISVGMFFDFYLNTFNENHIDPLAVVVIAVPCMAIAYSIRKYRMMNLNPKNIAMDVFGLMNEGIVVLDDKGTIQYANDGVGKLLGYNNDELLESHISRLVLSEYVNIKTENIKSQEVSLLTKENEAITVLLSSTISLDSCGEVLSVVLIFQDLTEVKGIQHKIMDLNKYLEKRVQDRTNKLNVEISRRIEIEKDIIHMANHDYLTDLPNRRCFVNAFNKRISIEKRLAVIYMDIDAFKIINDTFGHTVGDEILVAISKRLGLIIEGPDMVARIGGDEFLLLIKTDKDNEELLRIIHGITAALREPIKLRHEEVAVTTSIGAAIYPDNGRDFESLMKYADIALYRAKGEGKNKYMICNEELMEDSNEELRLTNSLPKAIENNEIFAYYQPKVNHLTKEIIGFEALCRWAHSQDGFISPGKFIPIAEKTGYIVEIGEYILKSACKQMMEWIDAGHKNLTVSVNISVIQIRKANFVERVKAILLETGLDAKHLELEVTESLLIKNSDQIIDVLVQLKNLGIKLSMDDFGTEYSSLRYLKYLPIDKIKIDREFVSHININEKDEKIIKSTIDLIQDLGFEVIAEGVETLEQADFLMASGCQEIQGFYYYKPLPSEEVIGIIKDKYLQVV